MLDGAFGGSDVVAGYRWHLVDNRFSTTSGEALAKARMDLSDSRDEARMTPSNLPTSRSSSGARPARTPGSRRAPTCSRHGSPFVSAANQTEEDRIGDVGDDHGQDVSSCTRQRTLPQLDPVAQLGRDFSDVLRGSEAHPTWLGERTRHGGSRDTGGLGHVVDRRRPTGWPAARARRRGPSRQFTATSGGPARRSG